MSSDLRPAGFRPSPAFVLLATLLAVLWLAGGSSRSDALGQAVVRLAVWGALVAGALLLPGRESPGGSRPAWLILIGIIALPLIQLVPLPPDLWRMLPGRGALSGGMTRSGWQPMTLVPGGTINALSVLVVPAAVLVLAGRLRNDERLRLPGLLLVLVCASAALGLLQFSGAGLNNPFINDGEGMVSGSFANRNHFALFVAAGIPIATVWAFSDGRRVRWRGPVAVGLTLLFALTILASGSRAGMAIGLVALLAGLLFVRQGLGAALRHRSRWIPPLLIAGIVGTIALAVLASVAADRAEAINRALGMEASEDMRVRALPVVLDMLRLYLPLGSGFGGFDQVFRLHEPFGLLQFSYLNHAHNDFVEIVLEGGLPALVLLVAALAWWAIASLRAWRAPPDAHGRLARLGSVTLLLVLLASLVDYPVRTPMMMAVVAIAALWLGRASKPSKRSALPKPNQLL